MNNSKISVIDSKENLRRGSARNLEIEAAKEILRYKTGSFATLPKSYL
jgi:hypothetical protein